MRNLLLVLFCVSVLAQSILAEEIDVFASVESDFQTEENNVPSFAKEIAADIDPLIIQAASVGDHELVLQYIHDDAHDVNERNGNGWTALTFAVANDHISIADELIHNGADVNAAENDGWTSLMFAAFQGNFPMVELFLENQDLRVDLNHQNNRDFTAHELALTQQHFDLANYIGEKSLFYSIQTENVNAAIQHIQLGINPNTANSQGWTALMLASSLGDFEGVQQLFSLGSDVNAQEHDHWTALIFAANNNHARIVHFLLTNGADATHVNIQGQTARDRAVELNFGEVVYVIDHFEDHHSFDEIIEEYHAKQN